MYLSNNIFVARIDRRSIVLDLARDRYIGLNPRLSEVLQNIRSSNVSLYEMTSEVSESIAKLFSKGIPTDHYRVKSRRNLPSADASQSNISPSRSIWALLPGERHSDETISIFSIISALVSLSQVATSLRIRPFNSTIDWLANAKVRKSRFRGCSNDRDMGAVQALVDAFDEIRPFFPLKPICRLDAPSLCLHLRRNGYAAQLVFGVRLDPFQAHCWVQIDEVAINEAWLSVRQYTPILIV